MSRPAASWVKRSSLVRWEKNPKLHGAEVEQIARSICRYGWGAPVLLRAEDRRIIAGHGRELAAELLEARWSDASEEQRLEWRDSEHEDAWHPDAVRVATRREIVARVLDLDESEASQLAIADNRLAELAAWDDAALADLLGSFTPEDVEAVGYDDASLAALLRVAPPRDPKPPAPPLHADSESVVEVVCGSSLDVLPTLDANSIDAVVTDPPYGLAFMGSNWDKALPDPAIWAEALRVAKPGAHLVAFGAPRLYHRLAVHIEEAGWELRDCLMWLFGTGFPKSLDVSKAIDAAAGAQRRVIGKRPVVPEVAFETTGPSEVLVTEPATAEARRWDGWGTALKPAFEPIVLARKPLAGSVAANVLEHEVGGINVGGCRIGNSGGTTGVAGDGSGMFGVGGSTVVPIDPGRWPANVLLDTDAAAVLDEAASGAPARFFYTAKASTSEREAGLASSPVSEGFGVGALGDGGRGRGARANIHPTVKPLDLMRWLVRLVTPRGGRLLDPFGGSGTTGIAAQAEGVDALLIELDPKHVEIARGRLGLEAE